ncbi:MAG: glucose-6-phosphate isomerase [Spirochaetales bacterium]|nr:glucose-6-phosphate isomerase [Spirochaetales bacterium]
MENLQSVITDFDLKSGLSKTKESLQRKLSNMKDMFYDEEAYNKALASEDTLVYEFYDMGVPDSEKEVAYGTSITYPGKIGDEYYMTKGHFHTVLDTAEVYYCLSGHGYMLMENPEGAWETAELTPGKAVYVQGRWAHRSINVSSSEPLVTFYAFPGHAGHDYGTIETKGFRKLIVEKNGTPEIIDNPKWK